jgi:hypothetical protein
MYIYRPLIVLAGSSDQPQESMGAFQEFPQVFNHIMTLLTVKIIFDYL